MKQNIYKINKNMSEEELSRRLFFNLIGIIAIVVIVGLSLFVFAPKIGYIFGLISVHRNDLGYTPTAKVAPPDFVDTPKALNKNQADLHGYAQPGSVVVVFVNGPERARTTAGSDGQFNFFAINLNDGKNTLFAKAIDEKNVGSANTEYFFIVVDKKAPKFEELSPSDGDTVKNLDKRIQITGKLDKVAIITINGRGAVQKPDLTFEFLLGVDEGNVKITIDAVDQAGNKTEKVLNITYQKKSF